MPPEQPQTGGELSSDERTWGMIAHLSALVLGFLGPLIVLLTKGKEFKYVEVHAKEALNFQITVAIAMIVCAITVVGILLIPVVGIGALVLAIMAGIKANDGNMYKYPLCLRLVK